MHPQKSLTALLKITQGYTFFAIFYSMVCLFGAAVAGVLGLAALTGIAAFIAQIFLLVFIVLYFCHIAAWAAPSK
jgi:hypothetical protein